MTEPTTPLDQWLVEVADALGLERSIIDRDVVLDLTKDVAHGVARPAAPLTAYLVGVAVGRGMSTDGAAATVRERLGDWVPIS